MVDDEPGLLRVLSRNLRRQGYEVETFESAEGFLARPPFDGVGCLLLDQAMPGMQGVELQQELEHRRIELPIIFLTAHADVDTGVLATRQGAVDFLIKPVGPQRISNAIESALALSRRRVELRQRLARLTPREHEVMTHVIAGELNKQIALSLGVAEDTVKVHRSRVMHKLEVDSLPALVRLCMELGIEPAGEPEP